MDVILSGWLYKSSSEKKLWKPFKQAWQKRFFVLTHGIKIRYKFELSYYDSEDRMNKKGSIDLDRCADIRMEADDINISSNVSHLLTNHHPFKYVFSLKTIHRSRDRVYFLGSESLESIDEWMQCLRTVLHKRSHNQPCDEVPEGISHFSSFKRPKSSDSHRYKHFSDHSGTRWGSFHALKGIKSHKKVATANNNSMDNLNYANSKSQQNISNHQQQKHLRKHHHHHQQQQHNHQYQQQQHHQQPQLQSYQQPFPFQCTGQPFDYIVPVQEGSFQDDLNESYVLLDQCFSGYENKIDQNNINNKNYSNNKNNHPSNKNNHSGNKYNTKGNNTDDYYNNSQMHNNKYYNTASDDNILLTSNNTKQTKLSNNVQSRKGNLHADTRSCNNLYNNNNNNRKQHHSISDDYYSYFSQFNNNNNNMGKSSNCMPPPSNCVNNKNNNINKNNNNNNNMRMYKGASSSQVMNRKSAHHSRPPQPPQPHTLLPHHYSSTSGSGHTKRASRAFKASTLRGTEKNLATNLGFYTLPPNSGATSKHSRGGGWYHKPPLSNSQLCVSDHSSDSNDEEDDDDDDDYYYDEDSSPFTESSDCPCKFYNCSNLYPQSYPLPPQQKQLKPQTQQPSSNLPSQHQHRQQQHTNHQQQQLRLYNNNLDTSDAYYNAQSLNYLELDLDQCSLNNNNSNNNNNTNNNSNNNNNKNQQHPLHNKPEPYLPKRALSNNNTNPNININLNNSNNYIYNSNNSATQYTQIDLNKTRGLQDTKFNVENERRNSDKHCDPPLRNHKISCPQSADAKSRFYPHFNFKSNNNNNNNNNNNTTTSNNNNNNNDNNTNNLFNNNSNLNADLRDLYHSKDYSKSRQSLLFNRGSYSNISGKKRNKKSYSSTVF